MISLCGQYIKALCMARGDLSNARAIAEGCGPNWAGTAACLKAAVAAMTGGDTSALISPVASDFAALLRPMSVVGKLEGSMQRTPFLTRTIAQSVGATAGWLGEAVPSPAGRLTLAAGTMLSYAKVIALTVVTKELVRFSDPSIEIILADDVARATALAMDFAFLDPHNAGIPTVRPASVTNVAPKIVSTGSTLAEIDADLGAALNALDPALDLSTAAWVMTPKTAVFLSRVRGTGGAAAYPSINAMGGELLGLPVLTSSVCRDDDSPPAAFIALVVASEVLIADDDNQAALDYTEEASLQTDSAPATGAQQSVSLWGANLVGIRSLRAVNWQPRRANAAATITGVSY